MGDTSTCGSGVINAPPRGREVKPTELVDGVPEAGSTEGGADLAEALGTSGANLHAKRATAAPGNLPGNCK